jgi:hypothetical protein
VQEAPGRSFAANSTAVGGWEGWNHGQGLSLRDGAFQQMDGGNSQDGRPDWHAGDGG